MGSSLVDLGGTTPAHHIVIVFFFFKGAVKREIVHVFLKKKHKPLVSEGYNLFVDVTCFFMAFEGSQFS